MAPKIKVNPEPGDRFGMLVVIEEVRVQRTKRTRRAILCKCDCGSLVAVAPTNLVQTSRSCGCQVAERTRERNFRHGLCGHPLFSTWENMVYRCASPRSPSYRWYGALGVTVHPSWLDPAVFLRYIDTNLGARPEGYTLDRIDPFGNYEPGNIRWASATEQTLNSRKRATA